MTMRPRILCQILILLTLLTVSGVSFGQSLYDVVISVTDRQQVVNQQVQVSKYLTDGTLSPPDMNSQINWAGSIGTNPTQSAVDGLDIAGKIVLLNQAVAEFDRLKIIFVNSSPDEFNSGLVVGALKPYYPADFDPLPRATPENYQSLLSELAQRIRALRLIHWPSAFVERSLIDQTHVWEELRGNEDYSGEHVEIRTDPGVTAPASVDWSPPTSIGPGNLDVRISDPQTQVGSSFESQLHVHGSYSEKTYDGVEITEPLHEKKIGISVNYPVEAKLSATAPGAAGTQIAGTVYILRRSFWHEMDISGASPKYATSEAGWVVEGSGNSGSVPLFGSPPTATFKGSWATTYDNYTYFDYYLKEETFVEDGYKYKKASVLDSYDPGYSDNYDHAYENNWKIGCDFSSVFKPTFTRGVDATGIRTKLESADGILADNSSDGKFLLHPRPGLLFGIELGPGLKGAGNGYVSTHPMEQASEYWGGDAGNSMVRFDSTYQLHFAGSSADYHVVYENDRSHRTQSLPTNGIGWPYTPTGGYTVYDTTTLYSAWDSPRLKQIAGRDLVADITYNSNHYGGYTIKIYRRPTGSAAPTPGQLISLSGMTLIRTWTFSHAEGSNAHPNDAEKLEVTTEKPGEKFEIQANEILPGLGLSDSGIYLYFIYYNFFPYSWWGYEEGTHSWTLKYSQGTTEMLKKDIEFTTNADFTHHTAIRESLDGQLVSSLSSSTLEPFGGKFPADWTLTSAGKTIIGNATLGAWDDPAFGYGKWPTFLSIQYDGIQPDAAATWDANGLLSSLTQGPWTTTGTVSSSTYKQTHKLSSSAYSTTWTEFTGGGNTIKTTTSSDGTATPETAWTEVQYGTASDGLPGVPFLVKNSDGSGTTFGWNASSDGSYIVTLEDGLLSGSSVSRGTKLIRSVNARGYPTKSESFVTNGGDVKTGETTYTNPTAWGIPKKAIDTITGLDSTWSFDDNLSRLWSLTNGLGTTSTFSGYDVLGRPGTISHNGISASNIYGASAGSFTTTRTLTAGATGSITDTRDALGRLITSNTTWNGVTDNLSISHGSASTDSTRTTLLGTYHSSVSNGDGSLTSVSGPTMPFGGTTDTDGLSVDTEGPLKGLFKTTTALSGQSAKFQTTWTDAWDRIRKTTTPTGDTQYSYSDPSSSLQRIITTEPSGRKLITESDPYNSSGSITRSGIDVDKNGALDENGPPDAKDRYVESTTTATNSNLVTVLKLTENDGLREILKTTWTPSGNVTVTTINGNEEEITRTPHYDTKTITTHSSKGWDKNESFNNLGLTTNSTLSGSGIPAAALNPTWRADGSLSEVSFTVDGATHSATFKNDGTLASLTVPGRGNILSGHSVSGGAETLIVDGVTHTRALDGTKVVTSGADVIGKTDEITTSGTGFNHATTPAVGAATNVAINAAGLPTAKSYAIGAGVSYGYTNGLLTSLSLARGGSLAFGYSDDGAKDLTSATWPEIPSGVFGNIRSIVQSYGHDRAGGIDQITDASGARSLTYQNGRLASTLYTVGPLRGIEIIRNHDASGRDTGIILKRDGATIHTTEKVPNGASDQITALASGGVKVVPQHDLSGRITGYQWGNASGTFTPAVIQTWTRGAGERIEFAGSDVLGAPSFEYLLDPNNSAESFDSRNRRLKCATAGGNWTYTYGINGQLTSAVHPILGSFNYGFDGIGRRTDKGAGNIGNLLNQTTAWTNSQNKTLRITAAPSARVSVWVNGNEIPNFTGSYTIPSPGASGGWVPWNTLAVLEGQGDPGANADAKAEKSGAIWVPPASETFTFDAAGNRQGNAQWDYGWDAKNQLVRTRTKNYLTAPQAYDITYTYDAEGRRVGKHVKEYHNGAIVTENQITFIWDGWDLIDERHQLPSGLTTLERKYLWGPDIANGGAGGAGGLLLIQETKGNSTQKIIPLYDGTGHVIALTNLNKDLLATYTYGPFGEKISATGPLANSNPWRWATKYRDEETGLIYFGQRYYDPITCQWLSREPLGESESINLYSYCGNDPVNFVDVLGLAKVATDGRGNLTALGQVILDVAKGDPNAARSLLMAAQVGAEMSGANVAGQAQGEDAIRNVTRAIETAVGQAQSDGRNEWKLIAPQAGADSYFGGYKDAWMSAKLAEYAPMIAANAGTAIQLRAAERAVNDKATAYQNSAAYKLREFADVPFDVVAFGISAGAATDVTTGNAVTWNSLNNGGGFGLTEVTPGERAFATAMVFLPVGRVGGVADDLVRVGMRAERSFAGTALKPWGSRGANFFENTALNATRNSGSQKLVLGHFARDGTSYQKVAAHYKATYFKVDDWNAVTKGLTQDEIWNINESFLTQQLKQGKQILFSHDPLSARPRSFFEREVNFLQDLGFGFRQKNPWTWEAFK